MSTTTKGTELDGSPSTAPGEVRPPSPRFDFDSVAVPSRYLAYAGDEIQWPEGRTISGYVNSAKVRQERAFSRCPMGGRS